MPSTADYCPFCGAPLSMDGRLDTHPDESADCPSTFARWRPGRSEDTDRAGPTRAQQVAVGILTATLSERLQPTA